jgi:hypothetical protein
MSPDTRAHAYLYDIREDIEILLIAIAPDLDRAFEACHGYLNDDLGSATPLRS